jgi:putative two-component system response regulator
VGHIENSTVVSYTDAVEAFETIKREPIDAALVDYMMPKIDGITFIHKVRALPGKDDLPIVMVTTSDEREVRNAALDAGATDFLTKPIDPAEVKSRVRNILRLRETQNKLKDHATWLAAEVRKATAALAAREEEIILRLSRAAEHRDLETGAHIVRMAHYCRLIAETMGLDEETCRTLYLAAPMHDVGKIAISDSILLKPGKLSNEERAVMEQHTTAGYKILADSSSELIQVAAEIALCHHERWDGTGYPRGLSGTDIPVFARIAAVADVFDALTTERPYKPAWPAQQAALHIVESSGKHFDPDCVAAFLQRWVDIQQVCADKRIDARAVA